MFSDPEAFKEYQKKYYLENIDRIKQRQREYYRVNREHLMAKAKLDREANPELTKLINQVTYQHNRLTILAKQKARRKRLKIEKGLKLVSNQ
jgi:hypothetical protein